MKKAVSVIAVVITVIALLGTVFIYFYINTNTEPLYIRTLIPSGNTITDPVQTDPTAEALVNINTAGADRLATLPGIGMVLAQRIVDYRTEHGPFQSSAELLNVPGIGEKKLENILQLITTGGKT